MINKKQKNKIITNTNYLQIEMSKELANCYYGVPISDVKQCTPDEFMDYLKFLIKRLNKDTLNYTVTLLCKIRENDLNKNKKKYRKLCINSSETKKYSFKGKNNIEYTLAEFEQVAIWKD